jgi:hypothetical protein
VKTVQVIAVCIALVLVVATVTAGIVYSVHQGTERRENCVINGGTWVKDSCVTPNGLVIP